MLRLGEKKKEERKKKKKEITGQKYNGLPYSIGCAHKQAWMEYKQNRQSAKAVISSAKEKKQKECASDLNDTEHQSEISRMAKQMVNDKSVSTGECYLRQHDENVSTGES